VTDQTFEIDSLSHCVTGYGGSFSQYKQAKESAVKNQWRLYSVQEQKFKQIQKDALAIKEQARQTEKSTQNDYIRGRAKKVAAKAKAREKRLEHMMHEERRVEKPRPLQRIRIDFTHSQLSRRALLELKDVAFSFADSVVLQQVNLQLYTRQRVVITGENGAGKSCLLNLIAGRTTPQAGSIYRSGLGKISYFPQDQEKWPEQIPLMEWFIEQGQISQSETNVRKFLHRFLFSRDDVYKDVSQLSCGERTRLKLAAIMMQNPDLILFDEPTNHLDIESIESIEQALAQFTGALLVVSHDRSFRQAIKPELYWHVENQCVHLCLPEV
jgi:ATPase subunit of ABC transporter with duplicated ATPase domains